MSQLALTDGLCIEVLPLHFNIAEHYLLLNEFIETANGTKAIVENFNKEFCGGKLQYQIVVLPPEKGSFKSRLGICVVAGVTFIWAFAESNIGQGYISGLTGQDPAYWARQAGIATKEAIKKEMEKETTIAKKAAAQILKECTKGFLEKDKDALRKIGTSKRHFREAYQAKNTFYEMCIKNPEIKGLGFDDTDQFPITRAAFPSHIVGLPPEDEDLLEHNWIVEEREINVTSPVWVKDGRLWQAKHDGNKETLFTMEDEGFWDLVANNRLKPKIPDLLLVQWAFIQEGKRRKKVRVLKVIEYNHVRLSNPLTNKQLNKILTLHSISQDNEAQSDFFKKRG